MQIDALDVLAATGLGLVALGLWLEGYPIALSVVGLAFIGWGIAPQIRRHR